MTVIVTDSAADLTADDLKTGDIRVSPLHITFGEETINSEELGADEFYDRLEAMAPDIPGTTQSSAADLAALYRQAATEGHDVFSIHISSGLSGTVNAAQLAIQQVPEAKVTLVDTLSLSPGERLPVLATAAALRLGWNHSQIMTRLRQLHDACEVAFTLETLTYLARGGRIGRAQALAGSLLSIKPVIRVDHTDGKYTSVGRTRTVTKSIKAMAAHHQSKFGDRPVWATVVHGRFVDEAAEMERALRDTLNVAKLDLIRISPVLGVHTGPGVVGAGVVPLELVDDLGL